VTAVIFDCDGTLVDSEPLARRSWERLLSDRGYALTDADYAAVLGLPYDRVHGYFADRVALPAHAVFWVEFSRALFEMIDTELQPFADALETVAALADAGAPLAVASSSPRERLDRSLARAGLTRAFATTVAGDEVARGKPAPDMYLEAARRLGVEPAACVAVEDTAPGVASARAAGMAVVGVARTPADRELLAAAHSVVDRLSALGVLGTQAAAA
jgi:HAD superfamily hydrolase (TIGR01509 family)